MLLLPGNPHATPPTTPSSRPPPAPAFLLPSSFPSCPSKSFLSPHKLICFLRLKCPFLLSFFLPPLLQVLLNPSSPLAQRRVVQSCSPTKPYTLSPHLLLLGLFSSFYPFLNGCNPSSSPQPSLHTLSSPLFLLSFLLLLLIHFIAQTLVFSYILASIFFSAYFVSFSPYTSSSSLPLHHALPFLHLSAAPSSSPLEGPYVVN